MKKVIKWTPALVLVIAICTFTFSSCADKKTEPIAQEEIKNKPDYNMENVIKIVAIITIKKEEDKADVIKALHAVVDGTRTEEGNISYVLHQDIKNPLVYVILEEWKSQEAIDFHNQTPHYKALGEAIAGKVDLAVNVIKSVY